MTISGAALVVGLGNPLRSDDGLGPAVIDGLRRRSIPAEVDLVATDRDGIALLELWAGRPLVVLVDAVRSTEGRPGTIHRLSGDRLVDRSVDARPATTHRLGLRATLELGEALDRRPARLVVYGVEAADLDLGCRLSPPVAAAVDRVVDRIERELSGGAAPPMG